MAQLAELREPLRIVTGLGWSIAVASLALWAAGVTLGWQELDVLAATGIVVLVLAIPFTLVRGQVTVTVRLDPPRVVQGGATTATLHARNDGGRRLAPITVEVPVGTGLLRFDLPSLAASGEHEELFVIRTEHRGVVQVGPASSVRSDPIGLLRRELAFSEVVELFVHPVTAALEPFGAGFLRDLEGDTADAFSSSDLAFHALRPYEAGDDRRHVHWRTTARMPSGKMMVRQYLDTRRSHVVVLLDGIRTSYASDEEFELAVSAAASFALRAVRDGQDVTALPGRFSLQKQTGTSILDTFSRAGLSDENPELGVLAGHAARSFQDASIAVLVTGSRALAADLHRASSRFDVNARRIAVEATLGATAELRNGAGLTSMRIGALASLSGSASKVLA